MTKVLALVAVSAAFLAVPTGGYAQQDKPYCLQEADGKLSCHFETLAQCQDALKGASKTGNCIPNPNTR